MSEHSPDVRLALLERDAQGVRDILSDIRDRMVTHQDMERFATRKELEALAREVEELKRISAPKLWKYSTTIVAGLLTILLFAEKVVSIIRSVG